MSDAFNHWTLPLVLQDPVLLNATMCIASAEVEIRNGTTPTHRSSSRAAAELANKGLIVSEYTYFKVQAIKQLNHRLSNPTNGKLGAPSICAIVFLLSAEVGCHF
jgi:Fungal specific transcription factor domain